MDQLQKGMMRAREGGLPLIGVDADPEVGHHDGETDHHDKDQPFLVRSLRLLRDTPIWKLEAAQVSIMP